MEKKCGEVSPEAFKTILEICSEFYEKFVKAFIEKEIKLEQAEKF